MKFTKRLCFLLLAILSVFVFALAGCNDNSTSSSSSSSSSSKYSNSSSSSSSSNNPESPTPESPTPETPPSTSEEQQPAKKEFFNATFYDCDFNSTFSDDRYNVTIEATPKYHIYNLQLRIKLYWLSSDYATVVKTFEQAPAYQKITFTVKSPNIKLSNGHRILIDWYELEVIGGVYDAEVKTFECNLTTEETENDFALYHYTVADDKFSSLIEIKTKLNIYDLKINADTSNYYRLDNQIDLKTIDFAPANHIISWRIFLPNFATIQGGEFSWTNIKLQGSYRIQPEHNSTPTADYWTRFK